MNDAFEILFTKPIISQEDMIVLVVGIFVILVVITTLMCADWKTSVGSWFCTEIILALVYFGVVWLIGPWKICDKYDLYVRLEDTVPVSFFDDYRIIEDFGDGIYRIREQNK